MTQTIYPVPRYRDARAAIEFLGGRAAPVRRW